MTAQRDEVLAKIREIEASCEGIENEHNAQRVQELNLEQAQLNAQKQELSAKLSAMNSRLSAISAEITRLSDTGIDRILEAIKNQRWYFFKNKTKNAPEKQRTCYFERAKLKKEAFKDRQKTAKPKERNQDRNEIE